MILSFAAVMLAAGFVTLTMAGYSYHGHGMGMTDMSKMVVDSDNQITFDEFSAPQLDGLRSAFNMLDTDNDGYISSQEYNDFLKVHGYGDRSEG